MALVTAEDPQYVSQKNAATISVTLMMPTSHLVSEYEREVCLFAPDSILAEIVRLRLATLRLRREIYQSLTLN